MGLTRGVRSIIRAVTPRRRIGTRRRPVQRGATGDLAASSVRIEYSPLLDGDPDPGEVVWTWVSYEDDPTQGKDRPVVIVGRAGDRLAGVALTSRARDRSDVVEVGSGAWDRSGRPSYAKLDRILAVDPEAVRREGSVLERQRFDALVAALSRVHASPGR